MFLIVSEHIDVAMIIEDFMAYNALQTKVTTNVTVKDSSLLPTVNLCRRSIFTQISWHEMATSMCWSTRPLNYAGAPSAKTMNQTSVSMKITCHHNNKMDSSTSWTSLFTSRELSTTTTT